MGQALIRGSHKLEGSQIRYVPMRDLWSLARQEGRNNNLVILPLLEVINTTKIVLWLSNL